MSTILGIDYPTLWFMVVGAVFTGYAILDGFDLGAGAWHLFFKKEESRRIALNAIGPVWDGNEVWLVIGGGTLFAGFPEVYATLFSAMYIPLMLFLAFLIFRAVSIEFRSKEPMAWWRKTWDVLYSLSSIILSLALGIVLGNVLLGMPLDAEHEYAGNWLDFVNIYAILVALSTLALFMMHGAIFLIMKTDGRLMAKLFRLLKSAIAAFVLLFGITSVYTLLFIPHLSSTMRETPAYFVVPLLAMLSIANIPRLANQRKFKRAFLFSSLTVAFLLITVAIELYPIIILATNDAANSLTVYNSAASEKTLGIMLGFVAVGAPLVASYTFFVYRTFWGKVELDETSY